LAEMSPQDRAAHLFCLTMSDRSRVKMARDKYLIMMLTHEKWLRQVSQPVSVWRAGAKAGKMRCKTIREMDKGGLFAMIAAAEARAVAAESKLIAAQMKAAEAEARAETVARLLKQEKEARKASEARIKKENEVLKVNKFLGAPQKFYEKFEFTVCMRLIIRWKFNIEEEQNANSALRNLKATIKATRDEYMKSTGQENELKYIIQCRYLEDKVEEQRFHRKQLFVLQVCATYALLGQVNAPLNAPLTPP
jgi:hypothetical protein